MDQNSIIKSYKRVSSFYDYTFGKVFKPGQRALIEKMSCNDSDIVLEIGI
ncbi:MAG: SAM-dependent methyltransferase, partial [Gammaproteobacteria bacterium]|nr:SAM-dependent methyltransferase [Gammaproteobacteria bacterium]